jgi:hypothetical protein
MILQAGLRHAKGLDDMDAPHRRIFIHLVGSFIPLWSQRIHQKWRLLGMLRRVALLRTDISEELSTSIIRVTRIGELGTTLAVTNNRRSISS